MGIKIDMENLINLKFNESMLKNDDRVMQVLIKTVNKYGFFGIEALKLWMDILNALNTASRILKDENNNNT